ncbi:MAG: hypothetical protein IPI83_07740 [Sphingomonadales bacterium]|nr:hypothetical protein [Sphingomonadales bacterium]
MTYVSGQRRRVHQPTTARPSTLSRAAANQVMHCCNKAVSKPVRLGFAEMNKIVNDEPIAVVLQAAFHYTPEGKKIRAGTLNTTAQDTTSPSGSTARHVDEIDKIKVRASRSDCCATRPIRCGRIARLSNKECA